MTAIPTGPAPSPTASRASCAVVSACIDTCHPTLKLIAAVAPGSNAFKLNAGHPPARRERGECTLRQRYVRLNGPLDTGVTVRHALHQMVSAQVTELRPFAPSGWAGLPSRKGQHRHGT